MKWWDWLDFGCFSEHLNLQCCCMSGPEVKPLHSEKVVGVGFFQYANWPLWSIFSGWWSLTHLLVLSLFPPIPKNQLFRTVSQGSAYREVPICHSRHHFWAWLSNDHECKCPSLFFVLDAVLAVLFQAVQAGSGHLRTRHLILSHLNPNPHRSSFLVLFPNPFSIPGSLSKFGI